MSGYAAFDSFIAGVDRLAKMNADVAKAAEKPIADVSRASAAAGESPSGEAWPDKKDGGKALPGAPGAIESSTTGSRVELKIGKPYVFHNHGAGGSSDSKEAVRHRERSAAKRAKSGTASKFHAPRRQILPAPGEAIPAEMQSAIAKVAEDVFRKAVG